MNLSSNFGAVSDNLNISYDYVFVGGRGKSLRNNGPELRINGIAIPKELNSNHTGVSVDNKNGSFTVINSEQMRFFILHERAKAILDRWEKDPDKKCCNSLPKITRILGTKLKSTTRALVKEVYVDR